MLGSLYLYRFGPETANYDAEQLVATADVSACALCVTREQRTAVAYVRGTTIYSSRSDRLGESDTIATLIANADSPALCADGTGSRVHLVYRDNTADEVRYDYSDDDLATVSGSPVTIKTGEPAALPLTLCMTAEGHLLCVLVTGGNLVTYRSTDSGETWSEYS